MKNFIFFYLLSFLSFSFIYAAPVIEQTPYGCLDWSTQTITLFFPRTDHSPIPSKEPKDFKAALQKLRLDYLSLLQSLRLDSATTVGELFEQDPNLKEECLDPFYLAQVVKMDMKSPGKPQIELKIPFYGETGIATLFFYKLLPPKDSPIRTTLRTLLDVPQSAPFLLTQAYTSVILDARKKEAYPCLSPEIRTVSGAVIYSASSIQWLSLLQFGMATYVHSLEEAKAHPQAGSNPLVLSVSKVGPVFRGDLFLSEADAKRLKEASAQTGFLEKGKVIILL